MMQNWVKAVALAVVAPLALAGCLFTPGKFESTLTIHADRSFTYAYRGEVVAVDVAGEMKEAMKGMSALGNSSDDADGMEMKEEDPATKAKEQAKKDVEYRGIAAALAKEPGYRQVEYRGNGLFYVDYALSGSLTHGFIFPYNVDAQMIFPFVVVELRGKDGVRVKAPGFAKEDSNGLGGMGGMGDDTDLQAKMSGTFTVITDAELVSQNNEAGAETVGRNRSVTWKVDHTTKDAPMAVIKVAPLP